MHNYLATWERSVDESDAYWLEQAKSRLTWTVPPSRACRGNFAEGNMSWFDDGLLNVSVNCLDRHPANATAIVWEGDEVGDCRHITYGEALADTCRLANALRSLGVRKGDRACREETLGRGHARAADPGGQISHSMSGRHGEMWGVVGGQDTPRRGTHDDGKRPDRRGRQTPERQPDNERARGVEGSRGRRCCVGDRVCVYMPMVPEAAYAMLACARVGAIHSVVFAGFSAEALYLPVSPQTSLNLPTSR